MIKLEIQNLRKRWPELSVGVDLSVESGSLTAIVGPSGCGKSTLLRMIAGLIAADTGSLRLNGRDIGSLEPAERKIGFVFQDYALFPHLNVMDNVAYGLHGRHLSRLQRQEQASRLLAMVGLEGFGRRSIAGLSGGEKQRVALARTMATNPELILFDEPLASLDASLRKRLRQDIRDEQQRLGFTALYVTHDLEEAMAIADCIAIMESGSILQAATPARIWDNPANARVARIMGNKILVPLTSLKKAGANNKLTCCLGTLELPAGNRADSDSLDQRWLAFPRDAVYPSVQASNPDTLSFEAECLSTTYLGDYREVRLKIDALILTTRQSIDCRLETGTRSLFSVPAAKISLLPD